MRSTLRSDGRVRPFREVGKRVLDLGLGLPALVALAPLFGLIAIAIRIDCPGPIFFRQERVGKDGGLFTCFKFRTMRPHADQEVHRQAYARFVAGEPLSDDPLMPFKLSGDSRITRVGAILRRTSMDELPQLLNVVVGNMSLVGPRPAIPYELMHYAPWHHERHYVKPGITGLWQVYGRSAVAFDGVMAYDVEYARSWTLGLDLKLIALTLPAMLAGRGAR